MQSFDVKCGMMEHIVTKGLNNLDCGTELFTRMYRDGLTKFSKCALIRYGRVNFIWLLTTLPFLANLCHCCLHHHHHPSLIDLELALVVLHFFIELYLFCSMFTQDNVIYYNSITLFLIIINSNFSSTSMSKINNRRNNNYYYFK